MNTPGRVWCKLKPVVLGIGHCHEKVSWLLWHWVVSPGASYRSPGREKPGGDAKTRDDDVLWVLDDVHQGYIVLEIKFNFMLIPVKYFKAKTVS